MNGKSLGFWQRIYYRLFKGVNVVDVGLSYKELQKKAGAEYINYSEGEPLSFDPGVQIKKVIEENKMVPKND